MTRISPVVLLPIVVIAYGYLKLRDAILRRRGATDEQIQTRSLMAVQNATGAWAGLAGLVFVCLGLCVPFVKLLTPDPITATEWIWSGCFILLGTGLLVKSASTLSSAGELKKLSKGRGSTEGILGFLLLVLGAWLSIKKYLDQEPIPWVVSGISTILGVCLLARNAFAVKVKKLSKGKVGE